MTREELIQVLWEKQDERYKAFQATLLPTVDRSAMIGVRVPNLRKLSKSIAEKDAFFNALPHEYYEEDLIHSILLSSMKDFNATVEQIERFLPYIDNWAVCDTLLPKCFADHKREVLPYVYRWISSSHTYTCRFAIGVLMHHFLKEDFDMSHLELVANVKSEEYYVKMMVAWYFATALAFQYEAVLPYLENQKLDRFTHQKTIQKAVESFRIPNDRKAYLKTLR